MAKGKYGNNGQGVDCLSIVRDRGGSCCFWWISTPFGYVFRDSLDLFSISNPMIRKMN